MNWNCVLKSKVDAGTSLRLFSYSCWHSSCKFYGDSSFFSLDIDYLMKGVTYNPQIEILIKMNELEILKIEHN